MERNSIPIDFDRMMFEQNRDKLFSTALQGYMQRGIGAILAPLFPVPVVDAVIPEDIETLMITGPQLTLRSEEGQWKYLPQAVLKQLKSLEIDSAVSAYFPLTHFVGVTVQIQKGDPVYRAYIIEGNPKFTTFVREAISEKIRERVGK